MAGRFFDSFLSYDRGWLLHRLFPYTACVKCSLFFFFLYWFADLSFPYVKRNGRCTNNLTLSHHLEAVVFPYPTFFLHSLIVLRLLQSCMKSSKTVKWKLLFFFVLELFFWITRQQLCLIIRLRSCVYTLYV